MPCPEVIGMADSGDDLSEPFTWNDHLHVPDVITGPADSAGVRVRFNRGRNGGAGQGLKLYLDRLPKIISETRTKDWYDCLNRSL